MLLRIVFIFLALIHLDVNAEEQKCLSTWPVFSADISGKKVFLLPSTHGGAFTLCPGVVANIQALVSRDDIAIGMEANTHTTEFPLQKINHGGTDWSPELSDAAKDSIEKFFKNTNAPPYIIDRFKKGRPAFIAGYSLMLLKDNGTPANGTTIDDLVFDIADQRKKKMVFVETEDEQIDALNAISPSIASKGIERLADYSLCDACHQLYWKWVSDTYSKFSAGKSSIDLNPWSALEKTGYPTFEFDRLATESRNYNLAQKIATLSEHGTNFFAIGAAHFFGANSVLNNLKSINNVNSISCKLLGSDDKSIEKSCSTTVFASMKHR
jgi:uncharacterized protein YbaP (TraB family)